MGIAITVAGAGVISTSLGAAGASVGSTAASRTFTIDPCSPPLPSAKPESVSVLLCKTQRDLTTSPDSPFTNSDITVNPGDTIQYQLNIINQTVEGPFGTVFVTDSLPPPDLATYNGDCLACEFDSGMNTLSWSLPSDFSINSFDFTMTLPASFPSGTTEITNTMSADFQPESVDAARGAAPALSVSLGTSSVNAFVILPPVSSIAKQQEDVTTGGSFTHNTITAHPGDTIKYQLTYTNSGTGSATLVHVLDTLPPSALATYNGDCNHSCITTPGTLAWDLATEPPGASVNLTYSVTLASSFPAGTTTVTNTVLQTSSGESDHTDSVSATVSAAPGSGIAKLQQDVTTGGGLTHTTITAKPGDKLGYKITYTNTGNATASNVVVTDTLPPAVLATYNADCSNSCAFSSGANTLTWNLGSEAAGASVAMTFTETLASVFPAGLTQVPNAVVETSSGESNHTDTVIANVGAGSGSSIVKQQEDSTSGGTFTTGTITANPGDTVKYQITYSNTGNAPATGVVVVDTLPSAGLATYNGDCSNSCIFSAGANTLTWNLGTENPGSNVVLTYSVKLVSTFPAGATTAVPNSASQSSITDPAVQTSSVIANVTRPAAAVQASSTGSPPVPTTGAGSSRLVLGTVLMLLGGVLLALSRRRRRGAR